MKTTENDIFYQAVLARDPTFDGKFFIGVKTTGIYCRPICPARPKRENMSFFRTAAQAEREGYRPCLRCRPEAAPDSPTWAGQSDLVRRGLALISEPGAVDLNNSALAKRLNVSARHLRRVFNDELGKTPSQLIKENRLNLARKLIVESSLPFQTIAFGAGFNSVRRFNDAIKTRFSQTPRQLRKRLVSGDDTPSIHFSLAYRPPLDWQGCLDYYRKHAIGQLETFEDGCYRRVFVYRGRIEQVVVSDQPQRHCLQVKLLGDNPEAISFVISRLKSLFDLSLDPVAVANHFDTIPWLNGVKPHYLGVRLAGCWDPFELAISTILGQLISIKRATQLVNELMEAYGEPMMPAGTDSCLYSFPVPEVLAGSDLSALRVPGVKKGAIMELSRRVADGSLHFSSYQDPQTFKQQLMSIKGIGRWSAEYMAMRAIRDANAFPEGDVYLKKHIDQESINTLSPWRGYFTTYLYKYGFTPDSNHTIEHQQS